MWWVLEGSYLALVDCPVGLLDVLDTEDVRAGGLLQAHVESEMRVNDIS